MDTRLRLRQRIAHEVARRLAEYGNQDDPARVLRRVARDMGVSDPRALPDRREVEAALAEQQRLFGPAERERHLCRLREEALRAMEALEGFSPRLAGPVLEGLAGPDSVVELHLHSDSPDDVALWLAEHAIPAVAGRRHILLDAHIGIQVPTHAFSAGGVPFLLVVLPLRAQHQSPLDPLGGGTMRRAGINQVRRLLDPVP